MADGKQEAIRRAVRAGLGLRLKKALPLGEALAFRIVSCIFLPKFMIYLFCGSSPLSYGRGGGDIDIIFIRSPGCGSQRLLRPLVRASHPAGRGPNSSSLFPPLAAVVAVASGLANSTRTVSPTKGKPPGSCRSLGAFLSEGEKVWNILTIPSLVYAIPRKSQALHRKFTETAAQRLSISFSPAFLSGCRTASGASLSGTWGF